MHRFYVATEQLADETVTLCPRETHHALHVLRVRSSEQVELLDGMGQVALAEVIGTGRREVRLRVRQRRRHARPRGRLTLVVGLVKGGAFEQILEKATELGVPRVQPVFTARTVVHIRPAEMEARLEKWRWVTVDALKQCGGPWLPEIGRPMPLRLWLEQRPAFDLEMYGALGRVGATLRHRLLRYRAAHQERPPETVAAYVGPEGDFSPEECAALEAAGVEPVGLGPRVLRSETAALVFAAIVRSEFDEDEGGC